MNSNNIQSIKYSQDINDSGTCPLTSLLRAPNTIKLDAHFRWGLIESDPDDNKFVDCAIVANANFIVTEDNHFNVLKHISFPHVNVLKLSEFDELMSKYR